MRQQGNSDGGEAGVDVAGECRTREPVIDGSTEEYSGNQDRQADQVVVGNGAGPQPGAEVSDHAEQAGGQKIRLQRGAEVLCGPVAQRAVDDQRRAVHAVGSAKNAGEESAGQQPGAAVVMQLQTHVSEERKEREEQDEAAEERFHQMLGAVGKEQKAEWNSEEGGENEPSRAAKVDVPPVLYHDNGCDGDGDENRERSRNLNGNAEGQQGNGDERFAETEGRADQGRHEDDENNEEKGRVNLGVSALELAT